MVYIGGEGSFYRDPAFHGAGAVVKTIGTVDGENDSGNKIALVSIVLPAEMKIYQSFDKSRRY